MKTLKVHSFSRRSLDFFENIKKSPANYASRNTRYLVVYVCEDGRIQPSRFRNMYIDICRIKHVPSVHLAAHAVYLLLATFCY